MRREFGMCLPKKKKEKKKNSSLRWWVIKMSSVDGRRLSFGWLLNLAPSSPYFLDFHNFSGTFEVSLKTREV